MGFASERGASTVSQGSTKVYCIQFIQATAHGLHLTPFRPNLLYYSSNYFNLKRFERWGVLAKDLLASILWDHHKNQRSQTMASPKRKIPLPSIMIIHFMNVIYTIVYLLILKPIVLAPAAPWPFYQVVYWACCCWSIRRSWADVVRETGSMVPSREANDKSTVAVTETMSANRKKYWATMIEKEVMGNNEFVSLLSKNLI